MKAATLNDFKNYITRLIKENFGLKEFRPNQVFQSLLDGKVRGYHADGWRKINLFPVTFYLVTSLYAR
jgi:hypothetical protein